CGGAARERSCLAPPGRQRHRNRCDARDEARRAAACGRAGCAGQEHRHTPADTGRTLRAFSARRCGRWAVTNILAIAAKEMQEGMRNRWVLATTLLLAALALTLTF